MSSIIDDIKNHFLKSGNTVGQLIIINVLVFLGLLIPRVLLSMFQLDEIYPLVLSYLALPAYWFDVLWKPWTLITYAFVHEGLFHILFNMLFLYTFGNIIADLLGSRRVTSLYIWGAIGGGIFYVLLYNILPIFSTNVHNSILLGASAAVFAIVVGASTLAPDYQLHLLLIGPIRIKYIAVFYLVLSYAQTVGENAGGNIAHLGGALLGYLFIKQLQNGNDWGKPVHAVIDFITGIFKPKPKMRVTYHSPKEKANSPSQAEIDKILDKISVSGYESLTKEEKQKLFSASKK